MFTGMDKDSRKEDFGLRWFAMRDIKRPNDPNRAYKVLSKKGFEVFTPLTYDAVKLYGRYVKVEKALFPDMLFVHASKMLLDTQVKSIPTLSYRKWTSNSTPGETRLIIVDDTAMRNFRLACASEIKKEFLKPSEIDASQIGRKVSIFCSAVDGRFTGNLLHVKGRGLKVLVELGGLLHMKLTLSKNDLVQFVEED